MSENLNENIYNRFGLKMDREEVGNGFRNHIKNAMWDAFYPLIEPTAFKPEFQTLLAETRGEVLRACCRELFLDYNNCRDGSTRYYIGQFIDDIFDSVESTEKLLLNIQVVLNVFWKHKIVHDELKKLTEEIEQYANDFPILGMIVKEYKTKASQILPSISKRLDKEIIDTPGVLDDKKYKSALNDFEAGVKIFAKAKTDSQFKDVVNNMHASCDEVVKVVLDDVNKGFKHAIDKTIHKKLGLNGYQKEIFKNLKNWMDIIKHGSKKNIDRIEVEMVISMSASFIRFVAVRHEKE